MSEDADVIACKLGKLAERLGSDWDSTERDDSQGEGDAERGLSSAFTLSEGLAIDD